MILIVGHHTLSFPAGGARNQKDGTVGPNGCHRGVWELLPSGETSLTIGNFDGVHLAIGSLRENRVSPGISV